MANRLRTKYDESVFAALKEKFNYSNAMEVPKLEKITINMGLGEAKDNSKILERCKGTFTHLRTETCCYKG